jgi:Rrf2 family protein
LDVDTEEYTDIQRAAISCEIPHKFLEGIAVTLKKHGILEVKRGAGGGYRLTRDPRNVSLAQIIEALEGISGKPNSKSLELTGQVIDEILADTIVEFRKQMESITLQDIHKKYYESADKLMYYI